MFGKKKKTVEKSKVYNESFEKLTDALDTDSINSIYPFSWIEKKAHIETGENLSLIHI